MNFDNGFPKDRSDERRTLIGSVRKIALILAVVMSLFHLYSSGVEMLPQMQHRAIHLALALALAFFWYPHSNKHGSERLPWFDVLGIVLSLIIGIYLVLDYENIVVRAGDPSLGDLFFGVITIVMVLEVTRRTMGWPLVIVALGFLAYAALGHLIPGALGHRKYDIARIIEHMFLTSEGIYGVAIYVTSTFVFVFILLGAFLTETGGAKAFIDLAFSLTGGYRGGPAKAAVIASGLMGTISGSAFANVAGTGTFTIPLMKSLGYKPEFAGGVEAAASAGGQIMPPIMGAAAFIMAEMTGVPYGKLIIYAAIPAILYYVAVFVMVDIEAVKLGLKGVAKERLPRFIEVLKRGGFLLLAPIGIFYMLIVGYSPIKASFAGVMLVILTSFLTKETRLNIRGFMRALELGAISSLSVIAACACAGLIVGSITLTGIGLKFADLVVAISRGNVYLASFMAMFASIVMGMGMPTTALYIILGSIVAPAMVKLGVPVVAAHLFIFYFGCMAAVTPPVALSSYLAAAIAKADPISTALNGLKLSLAAFILPFLFIVNPELLLLKGTLVDQVWAICTAMVGVFALAGCLEGYFGGSLRFYQRLLLGGGALGLMHGGKFTDVLGLILLLGVLIQKLLTRRKRGVSLE